MRFFSTSKSTNSTCSVALMSGIWCRKSGIFEIVGICVTGEKVWLNARAFRLWCEHCTTDLPSHSVISPTTFHLKHTPITFFLFCSHYPIIKINMQDEMLRICLAWRVLSQIIAEYCICLEKQVLWNHKQGWKVLNMFC